MNVKITQFLKSIIDCKGIKYTFISEKSGIVYERLVEIFDNEVIISGSELICLCRVLEVEQSTLMKLLEDVI